MSILVAVGVVLLAGFLGSRVARWWGLPGVIGQMVLGLVPGPLVLGALLPSVEAWVFPAGSRAVIATVGGIAAGLLLFLNGASHGESGHGNLRSVGVLTAGNFVAAAAAVVPVMHLLGDGAASATRCCFLVIAFGVCALPVLARIIEENGLTGTRAASYAFSVGVCTDVVAWCGVAVLAGVQGSGSPGRGVLTVVVVLAVVACWAPLRRATCSVLASASSPIASSVVAAGCAAGGVAIAWSVGVDAILGALVGGMVFGAGARRSAGTARLTERVLGPVRRVNAVVLLPVFFASVGLSVQIHGGVGRTLLMSLLVTVCAVLARAVGTMAVYRWTPLDRDSARVVYKLLCSRGATELAMLRLGTGLGLLPAVQLTPFVVMPC